MKRNKLIYLFASLALVATSCKDSFLEEKQDYTGFNEQVFQDPALAQGYVDYVYGLFEAPANAQSMTWNLATANDDFTKTTEELPGETNWNKEWATISYNNANDLPYFGARLSSSIANNTWTRMKQINIFLQEIDKYGIPEETRNKLKGQMYFWRAWQYFDLVRLYGGVSLVLVPQNPIVSAGDNTQVPRSTSSACIEQIVKDLDLAMQLLPGKWTGSDNGRITSGAAAALKGRVLLTWASPLFNRTDDRARWERAYQANLAAKTLLEANGFGLYKVGTLANGTAWGNMWFTDNSPEAVFSFGFNNVTTGNPQKNNGWEQAVRSKTISGSGSVSPTKEMVDAFPMKDGKQPGSSTYAYAIGKFYKNRDPRFYKTFIYNGAPWPYKDNTNYKQWTYVWKKTAAATTYNATTETAGANSSGIYLCKAANPNASNITGSFQLSPTDFMEIRFAEVLLNLAESAIGADKDIEGLGYIKLIRERAGVENLDGAYGLGAVSGRDPSFAAVLNERKIELAYEGKRFWDLRRWMLFEVGSPTAARLGITPLNGTRRTGFFVSVKTGAAGADYVAPSATSTVDPMVKPASGNAPVADRDATTYPAGITTYDQYLDYLYDNYFKVTVKDDLDRTSAPAFKFIWYPQYYFFGINNSVLTATPYLEQTVGWDSMNGAGTFDPLK
ncbi:RagB/SusD family nutrient uptake outer membrane protein [Pedobacter miscanthi]|uniref:RagB/SusD family nutrient uptake outer membrane protein n=1 Tax=Pedobacter miscanthi TaxID=2259170 RepID=A0A366KQV0_9SPHI|nr:RagB/SusD family nutrient uptake outer membrane protein [Pedobacter miscanthi]RBQ04027.1 RagB/SusD family nutrient uptake outer membrane protein [Pedobacter miscanthi]